MGGGCVGRGFEGEERGVACVGVGELIDGHIKMTRWNLFFQRRKNGNSRSMYMSDTIITYVSN